LQPSAIRTINLETGMLFVHEAVTALDRGRVLARRPYRSPQMIHGRGSSGYGSDLGIAVQKGPRELENEGAIQGCIVGEDDGRSIPRPGVLPQASTVTQDRA
jgi:hypothetical protein